MSWIVVFHPEFEAEFDAFPKDVQDEFYAEAAFVELFGPATGRPHVDTLSGSKHKNMKELGFEAANSEWRCAFAFDPKRNAIMLVAGDKGGDNKFYQRLIQKADRRFDQHLESLKFEEVNKKPSPKKTGPKRK